MGRAVWHAVMVWEAYAVWHVVVRVDCSGRAGVSMSQERQTILCAHRVLSVTPRSYPMFAHGGPVPDMMMKTSEVPDAKLCVMTRLVASDEVASRQGPRDK